MSDETANTKRHERTADKIILVTPEMVEAGFRVLASSGIADEYLGADRLLVEEIFRAMVASAPQ